MVSLNFLQQQNSQCEKRKKMNVKDCSAQNVLKIEPTSSETADSEPTATIERPDL
jgi:hypothetical protein